MASQALADAEKERQDDDQARALNYGLHALQRWADTADTQLRRVQHAAARHHAEEDYADYAREPERPMSASAADRRRSPSRQSSARATPKAGRGLGRGFDPGRVSSSAMDMLAEVKGALGALRADAPRHMTLDGSTGGYVAQVEANKLQLAMKRRRMKPLPSMPTQQACRPADRLSDCVCALS